MEFHTSKTSLLILAILLIAFAPRAFSITLFDYSIYLNNSANQTLTAHCTSNGADAGELTIAPHEWRYFLSHVLVKERTVATCSITLGKLHGSFDVFDFDRDKKRCPPKVCYWTINEIGLYLRLNNAYILQFQWP